MNEKKKDGLDYFNQVFEEGRQFTEELLRDNQRMREQISLLEHEVQNKQETANLKDKINDLIMDITSANGTIDMLQEQIGDLTKERDAALKEAKELKAERDKAVKELGDIKDRLSRAQKENQEFEEQYLKIEKQNENFAALYVSSYQLHSTLKMDEVLKLINEIVINLVGSDKFGVYLFDKKQNNFTLMGGEELDEEVGKRIELGENFLTELVKSRRLLLREDFIAKGYSAPPTAAIPLVVGDELLGAIIIQKLLVQKIEGVTDMDFELFDLLSGHAATALMAAKLFDESNRKSSTLVGFFNLLKDKAPEGKELEKEIAS